MKIASHKLVDTAFVPAHACGGEMVPTLIVLHDTAGRLDKGSSVNWFKSEDCNVSAHVVVERDGAVTQMVPFNRKAWHAGASVWKGKSSCNGFAIGIEIVNPGKLDKDGKAWFGQKFKGAKRAQTKAHGDGWWLDYTPEQIEAVTALCYELVSAYPGIEDITTHWAISPGRKIDTNPLFPLDEVREAAFATAVETAPMPPMQPEIVKPVAQAAKSSRTVFGVLTALGASLVGWMQDTVAQLELLEPVKQIGSGLGLNAATILFGITVAGLALALFARLDDARTGKVVK